MKLLRRCPYTVDRTHPAAMISVALMVLCALIRSTYYALTGANAATLAIYLVLPCTAALWLVAVILLYGKDHIALSCISVLLGVVFFMIKATTFESELHTTLCMILYSTVLVLYTLVMLGLIPKVLLYPLFGLPLLYHVFVEDMQLYILAKPRVPFVEWLPEISVLCIMGALLALSFALKKRT